MYYTLNTCVFEKERKGDTQGAPGRIFIHTHILRNGLMARGSGGVYIVLIYIGARENGLPVLLGDRRDSCGAAGSACHKPMGSLTSFHPWILC